MDLALLAACNHTILTYGTFGFWAGFLAGGGNGKRILPQEKVVFAQKISNISENQRFPFFSFTLVLQNDVYLFSSFPSTAEMTVL
jgi:hypothetical protein